MRFGFGSFEVLGAALRVFACLHQRVMRDLHCRGGLVERGDAGRGLRFFIILARGGDQTVREVQRHHGAVHGVGFRPNGCQIRAETRPQRRTDRHRQY